MGNMHSEHEKDLMQPARRMTLSFTYIIHMWLGTQFITWIYHLGGVKCVARYINPYKYNLRVVRTTANFWPPAGVEHTTKELPD